MSTPKEHSKFQFAELRKLEDQVGMMRSWGVSELDPGFKSLLNARGAAMSKLGIKLPRTSALIKLLLGLSPGTIKVWSDAELGWMIEAIAGPGSPPVYKSISNEVAKTLITGKLTHELEESLMAPDTYFGE